MDAIQTTYHELAGMLPDGALLAIAVTSAVMFVGTMLLIPLIVVRLPSDYFLHDERTWMAAHHPIARYIGLVAKNIVGLLFLLAGIAMLVLPGQGLLTMVIGIALIDFPGKHHIERRLLANPLVLQAMNAIRHKFGKPALSSPADNVAPRQTDETDQTDHAPKASP